MSTETTDKSKVTVAFGDGIGPEIMGCVLRILEAAGAQLELETVKVGCELYEQGIPGGIGDEAWESLHRTKVFLKAPITTPQGAGVKSLNVTVRKTLGLFANVRPCIAYHPFVATPHPGMNLVVIRENEEDLYTGIEYRQTDDVVQGLKIISATGCRRIIRYAFEYARSQKRQRVTCMTKDNIMKMTDGLFHRLFREIGEEYPDIEQEHRIIDIGAALVGAEPGLFDVIVTPNLYGDIISDIAAQVSGSIGLAGSANIGSGYAMFEAVHGSAPDIAGKDIANPSGLLLAAIQMLQYLQQPNIAETVYAAWLKSLEAGLHTADIFRAGVSKRLVGTNEFGDIVIGNLGEKPSRLGELLRNLPGALPAPESDSRATSPTPDRTLVGVDVFLNLKPCALADLANRLQISSPSLKLKMIAERGMKVWPGPSEGEIKCDLVQCRFLAANGPTTQEEIIELLRALLVKSFDCVKTEQLYTFDGEPGFSAGQGE